MTATLSAIHAFATAYPMEFTAMLMGVLGLVMTIEIGLEWSAGE